MNRKTTYAKISKILCHESFPVGSPPLSLKLKKDMFFQPKSNKDLAILRAAHGADKARVLWLVGVEDGKLMPKGNAQGAGGYVHCKLPM